MDLRSVGVEEELLLIEPATGRPLAVSGAVLLADGIDRERIGAELQREQLEIDTRPCRSLDELSAEVRRRRRAAATAAQAVGAAVVAMATSPFPVEPSITPKSRYRWMAREYALTADETLTCGCHVHVEVASDEEGVAVLDRIRAWLPPLLALSANSPFWQGHDTEYASYRQRVWCRWPSAGPTGVFGSADAYHSTVRAMVESGALLDEGMIYFDARLSRHYPTVEVRVADVCLDADDTVLLAALARALVETAARAWQAGEPPAPVRTELMRLAAWRASRSGLTGDLIHPASCAPAPAAAVLRALLDHVAPVLADSDELTAVDGMLRAVLARGTGADHQRAVYRRRDQFVDVVSDAVTRTTDF